MTPFVLVLRVQSYEEYLDCDITDVYVSDMSQDEIEAWIETGKALDKAGAYAIQDEFAKYIEKIDGNYYTVVGLPINRIYKILKTYIKV